MSHREMCEAILGLSACRQRLDKRFGAVQGVEFSDIEELEVVTPGANTPVRRLSGGNVQKVLVGREIAASPTEETITPSHIPTRMVSACSMIRGMIRRISLWLEKSLCSVNDLTSLLYLQRVYHGKMRFSI